ncbi:hypothetical protein GPX89_10175 [Nocardia sp. ET3-3]|uniref:Uncharacterized protein n=1 Tax=Nocardia terrae TaxID=2675851 RepID=A0A7K1UTD1_9NOCA|nr:hypothetical protein [Nocardia terrae]MVU77604.1 hypothetical protein [Nocardia terrae]
MDAIDVCADDWWDDTDSAVACVADISVDGGAPMPMVGLLAANGELVIPTNWDDPPVADGARHTIRVELRASPVHLAAGRVQAMLEGCHAWRLGYGTAMVEAEGRGRVTEPAHVIATSTVPCSVRAKTSVAGITRAR